MGRKHLLNGEQNETYISDIQHVRRETIAMTPSDSFTALKVSCNTRLLLPQK
jgi:hypothetical protein